MLSVGNTLLQAAFANGLLTAGVALQFHLLAAEWLAAGGDYWFVHSRFSPFVPKTKSPRTIAGCGLSGEDSVKNPAGEKSGVLTHTKH